jgi:hypothetical protein
MFKSDQSGGKSAFLLQRFLNVQDSNKALHATFNTLAIHLNQEDTQKNAFFAACGASLLSSKEF